MLDPLLSKDFLQVILDLYSLKTNMSIGYINRIKGQKAIWQSDHKYCSPLCKFLKEIEPEWCKEDHHNRTKEIKNNTISVCHAGLLNYLIPLVDDD